MKPQTKTSFVDDYKREKMNREHVRAQETEKMREFEDAQYIFEVPHPDYVYENTYPMTEKNVFLTPDEEKFLKRRHTSEEYYYVVNTLSKTDSELRREKRHVFNETLWNDDLYVLHNVFGVPEFMISEIKSVYSTCKENGLWQRRTDVVTRACILYVLTKPEYERFGWEEETVYEWFTSIYPDYENTYKKQWDDRKKLKIVRDLFESLENREESNCEIS